MSESGGRDPIIIPIGFIIDETSLETAMEEAKRRFSTALGVPEGITPSYHGFVKEDRAVEEEAADVYDRKYSEIDAQIQEFERNWMKIFTGMDQQARSAESYFRTIDRIVGATTTTVQREREDVEEAEESRLTEAVEWESFQEKKVLTAAEARAAPEGPTGDILSISERSMFDAAQRRIIMDEAWTYFKNWVTNIPGPGGGFESQPTPFARATAEGLEEERFEDVALIASGGETRRLLDSIIDKIGDDELRWEMYDEDIMSRLTAIMGGVTEEGGIGLQFMFSVDEMDEQMVESASRMATMFQEKLTEALRRDYGVFVDITEELYDKIAAGFTERGKTLADEIGLGAPDVKSILMPSKTPEERDLPTDDKVKVLVQTTESLMKISDRAWGRVARGMGEETDESRQLQLMERLGREDLGVMLARIREEEGIDIGAATLKKFFVASRAGAALGLGEEEPRGVPREPGEIVERRLPGVEEMLEELSERRELEEMIYSPEGIRELKEMVGPREATRIAEAVQQYVGDFTEKFGMIRFHEMLSEFYEGDLVQKQREGLPPPTAERDIPIGVERLTTREMPEVRPTGGPAMDIGSLFRDAEERMGGIEQIVEWAKKQEAEKTKEEEIAAFLRPYLEGEGEEEVREDWEVVFGPRDVAKEIEEAVHMAEINRSVGALADRLEAMLTPMEEGIGPQLHPSDRPRAPRGLTLSDEDFDEISTRVSEKVGLIWQQTIGGWYTPERDTRRPRLGGRRSKTFIGKQLEVMEDATRTGET